MCIAIKLLINLSRSIWAGSQLLRGQLEKQKILNVHFIIIIILNQPSFLATLNLYSRQYSIPCILLPSIDKFLVILSKSHLLYGLLLLSLTSSRLSTPNFRFCIFSQLHTNYIFLILFQSHFAISSCEI